MVNNNMDGLQRTAVEIRGPGDSTWLEAYGSVDNGQCDVLLNKPVTIHEADFDRGIFATDSALAVRGIVAARPE